MKTKLIKFAIKYGYKPYFIWENVLHSNEAVVMEHALIYKWLKNKIFNNKNN